MTLSPKFRLAVIQSSLFSPSSSETEMSLSVEPLIPGLPDDVALNCMLRLPIQSHEACRSVCKRWHLLLSNKERFFSRRKEFGLKDPWLFVFAFHKCTGKIQWQVLDLTHFSWHTIPAMPCKDKYEILTNRWTVMNNMIDARSFFASGMIDGRLFVAGGTSANLFDLDSAEVFDLNDGTWRGIANMGTNMASYDAAVLDGKLLMTEGWLWPFYVSPRGQVYDPVADKWENMPVGLREGWTGSSVVVYGHLFVVAELERMKLKVYDGESDSWEALDGPPLPEQICKPFVVSAHNRTIYVVGRNLSVALGQVSMLIQGNTCGKKCTFSIRWRVIDAPENFSDLTPSSSQVLFG